MTTWGSDGILRAESHRCHPPHSSWWAGHWHIGHYHNVREGDQWRCHCGQGWKVTTMFSQGLWEDWTEDNNFNSEPTDPSPSQFDWSGCFLTLFLLFVIVMYFVTFLVILPRSK